MKPIGEYPCPGDGRVEEWTDGRPEDWQNNLPAFKGAELCAAHRAMPREGSGIAEDMIAARGYRTITETGELEGLGFGAGQRRVPGLLLPLWTPDGLQPVCVYRPDSPRVSENRHRRLPDGTHPCREVKYELPRGAATHLDCPPPCRPLLADPAVRLWVTEGQKKADSLASRALCAVALLGVWNWRGKNALGGTTFLAEWDYVALDGRQVVIVFDSDLRSNGHVRQALRRLATHLQRRRAHVSVLYLPPGPEGEKVGVDDYLGAGHSVLELEALIEGPRPQIRPAEPLVELLEAPPGTLRRPLALIDGCAYAATWLHVKETVTEALDKYGQIVQIDPPQVTTRQRLFVVRSDGTIFGAGGDRPLDELGLEVQLSEIPPPDRLWPAPGLKAFRAGQRPQPAAVFGRVVDVVD